MKRPVVAASVAAGIGGIVGGLFQVSLYIAQNCIMAIPAFIGDKGMSNLLYGIIMIIVSFVASFILTFILGFEDVKSDNEIKESSEAQGTTETQQRNPLVEKVELYAPVTGTVKTLANVADKTFADKVLGDGAAIFPSEGRVYAPARRNRCKYHGYKTWNYVRSRQWSRDFDPCSMDTVTLNGTFVC